MLNKKSTRIQAATSEMQALLSRANDNAKRISEHKKCYSPYERHLHLKSVLERFDRSSEDPLKRMQDRLDNLDLLFRALLVIDRFDAFAMALKAQHLYFRHYSLLHKLRRKFLYIDEQTRQNDEQTRQKAYHAQMD